MPIAMTKSVLGAHGTSTLYSSNGFQVCFEVGDSKNPANSGVLCSQHKIYGRVTKAPEKTLATAAPEPSVTIRAIS